MILINRTENDPYFNIAAEEYVLKVFHQDVFMLWVNSPSVIIGKHQNAVAETDIMYTFKNHIPVVRRISGGGTVYHDEGNLNYSLVVNGEQGKLVDYLKYAGTVIRTLERLSVKAVLEGKSSLFTAGKKFSGNAEHVFRNRVLHHGTLLFNTDPEMLRNCIRPAHTAYDDKSVRSVDSKTTNLARHLAGDFSMEDLRNALIKQVMLDFRDVSSYSFTEKDRAAIQKLVDEKYSGLEWNFGYSPKYVLNRNMWIGDQAVKVSLKTEKGILSSLQVSIDGEEMDEISARLIGIMHHPGPVLDVLNKFNFASITKNISPEAFLTALF
ncbi:MAG: hypothetical protein DRJ15_06055 [Bacteroidetes bacterium]|nr:MAG: hypothetical protein DRJ15_06055 [Bacteroidota bacterium]